MPDQLDAPDRLAGADLPPVTVDRRRGPYGEVVLRRRGAHFEIIANGCFLMDTRDGRSERLLVDAALDALTGGPDPAAPAGPGPERPGHQRQDAPRRDAGPRTAAPRADDGGHGAGAGPGGRGPSVLIGGLGVGFSLARAAASPRWARITVVERERAVVDWHRAGHLAPFSAGALDDPRVDVIDGDLVTYLAAGGERYDALCLDVDNGPDWTVTESNDSLYTPDGLARCRTRLRPGGVLALWSAQPSPAFEQALRGAGFVQVGTVTVPVARGVPDVVHLARRPPRPT